MQQIFAKLAQPDDEPVLYKKNQPPPKPLEDQNASLVIALLFRAIFGSIINQRVCYPTPTGLFHVQFLPPQKK
ncbi:hypothetical protein [Ottowia sp.]|uniref:hypothetical protein n=1 Tax=Ottowia sp. TaxID=1898956 RepID=UPI003A837C48